MIRRGRGSSENKSRSIGEFHSKRRKEREGELPFHSSICHDFYKHDFVHGYIVTNRLTWFWVECATGKE